MNYQLLNDKITELGVTKKTIQNAWNCSYLTALRKIEGSRIMNVDEANTLANVLRLTDKEKMKIFFGK